MTMSSVPHIESDLCLGHTVILAPGQQLWCLYHLSIFEYLCVTHAVYSTICR